LWKIAQIVAKLILVENLGYFQKLLKDNNHPMIENSHNLVILGGSPLERNSNMEQRWNLKFITLCLLILILFLEE
jgi:hypothetical protein